MSCLHANGNVSVERKKKCQRRRKLQNYRNVLLKEVKKPSTHENWCMVSGKTGLGNKQVFCAQRSQRRVMSPETLGPRNGRCSM